MSILQCLSPGPVALHSAAHQALPHVLFVLDGFPKTLGGGERIVLRQAELLPHYGFRASILTLSLHPESAFRPEDAPCPVYLLPLTSTYNLTAWRGALELGRFLRREKVEIVQTFFESSDLWAGLVTRSLSHARLVWNRRDMGILRSSKHIWAYRASRRLPHAVCAVSQSVAQHVINVDGVTPGRVHVVHNGLALTNTQRSSGMEAFPKVQPQIKTIGNIRHVKGHDILVEAAALVLKRFPDALFSVAGEVLEPDFFHFLQQRVADLQIQNNFQFVGKVSDLDEYLSDATIFALPSRSEGFSNALIEAMAQGLPAVVTDVGGNAEAVTSGVNGLVVPSLDAEALGAALLALLEEPAKIQMYGHSARKAVENRFSVDAMMRQLQQIFTSALGRNDPTQG